MKDKILKFIQNIKLIFSEKQKAMGKLRAHQPHILEIQQDETQLDTAYTAIEQLDEAKANLAAHLLHQLIDIVIPIFAHWRERINKAIAAHPNLSYHAQAKSQYEVERSHICLLIENINTLDEEPLIALQPTIENPGNEIVIRYKQQRISFLVAHGIIESEKPPSEIKISL